MVHTQHIEAFNALWHRMINLKHVRELEQRFERLKAMSTAEIGIVNMVARKPDIIFREICELLDLAKSTLTNMIDRLENRGYLKRTLSRRDRRSYGLELTEEGRLVQDEHERYEYAVINSILDALDTNEEREQLISLMGKIALNLEGRSE